MLGHTHALSGAAAWLALTSTSVTALGWSQATPVIALSGAVLAAGAALQPDLDTAQGTIAHSLPGVSRPLAQAVAAASGGHRHGTHGVIGIAAFTALAWAACHAPTTTLWGRPVPAAAGIYAVILVALALKALELVRGRVLGSTLGPWIVALGTAGWLTWQSSYHWPWLPQVVALGALVHILGDGLTVEGVPWLWPWNPAPPSGLRTIPGVGMVWQDNGYFRMPLLGETGSARELGLAVLLGLYVAYQVLFEISTLLGVRWLR